MSDADRETAANGADDRETESVTVREARDAAGPCAPLVPDGIPDELTTRPQYLLYDVSSEQGKRPCWRGNYSVSWTNPDDWHTFEEALSVASERPEWGIGFVAANGVDEFARGIYGCLDIDGALVEDEDGDGTVRLADWVPSLQPFIERGAFIDISPGGYGLHIPLAGFTSPEWWDNVEFPEREHTGVEAYGAKFITVTGDRFDGSGDRVADAGDWVHEWLWDAYVAVMGEPPVTPDDTADDSATRDCRARNGRSDREGDGDFIELSPDDLPLKSSYAGSESVGVESWDPGYRESKSGRSLKRFTDTGLWVDMKHYRTGFDTLALFAAEQGIIKHPTDRLTGDDFKRTLDLAREAGADVPNPTPPDERDGAPDDAEPLSRSYIEWLAELGDDETIASLTDREKAYWVGTALASSDSAHVIATDDGVFYAYEGGIWKPNGEQKARKVAQRALGPSYGANVLKELKEFLLATATVPRERMGVSTGTLAIANGLLDLDAAAGGAGDDALRELRPDDYALTRLPVAYDPHATYDDWHAYVEDWVEDGRADMLQEYVGYCLHVGELPYHCSLLLVGSGANGKSTFLAVVRALLGEQNTTSIELQTLANERDAVADFYGALANIDDDLSSRSLGRGLGMFKKLTGDNLVRARHLWERGFEFRATGKHLYAANEVPDVTVPDDDEAFWRRWLLVEFPNHYGVGERDPTLRDRLTEPTALSSVLNWAIDGRRRLLEQDHFTNEEKHAHQKRERWQAWGESVDKFISQCVSHDDDAPRISTTDAHRRYAAWCRANDEEPVGQQQFTNTLKQEDVGYVTSLRIDGNAPTRGYKFLGFSGDVPAVEDTPERGPEPTAAADDSRQDSLF